MDREQDFGEVRTFRSVNVAVRLRAPGATPCAAPMRRPLIPPALEAGLAVFVQSRDVRALAGRRGDKYLADHPFLGPSRHLKSTTAAEVADFAAGPCE